MSRLIEILGNCACTRKLKSNKSNNINSAEFWKKIDEINGTDGDYKLIHEKNIYLNDECGSVITIGMNPRDRFEIYVRLEMRLMNSSLLLDSESMTQLLHCLVERFHINAVLPTTLSQNFNKRLSGKQQIGISSFQQSFYKIIINQKNIKLDHKTIEALLNIKSYVMTLISLYEAEREKVETNFFKLLNYFCYGKTFHDINELLKNNILFNELIGSSCIGLEDLLAVEIAVNFSAWFIKCIPMFMKTLMIDEKIRLLSYSSEWKGKYQNVETLAKSGLYYTGTRDQVACVFCNINLIAWEPNDDPIYEHYKYSPNCTFLSNPFETSNVIDGNKKDLEKLLSVLDTRGIDVPDEVQNE